jgi:RimJ/RimL family protein N-acetyltransferase
VTRLAAGIGLPGRRVIGNAVTVKPPETIDAGELTLKRWEPQWADEAAAAVQESLRELKPYLPWAHDAYDVADARGYIEMSAKNWAEGREFNYAVITAAGDLAGSIGLMSRVGPGALEIGYWTRTACAGRGYMTTAVRTLAAVALTLPGIERLVIKHDVANGASAAVAAKAGFAPVAHLPRDPEAPGGTGTDVVRERRS